MVTCLREVHTKYRKNDDWSISLYFHDSVPETFLFPVSRKQNKSLGTTHEYVRICLKIVLRFTVPYKIPKTKTKKTETWYRKPKTLFLNFHELVPETYFAFSTRGTKKSLAPNHKNIRKCFKMRKEVFSVFGFRYFVCTRHFRLPSVTYE